MKERYDSEEIQQCHNQLRLRAGKRTNLSRSAQAALGLNLAGSMGMSAGGRPDARTSGGGDASHDDFGMPFRSVSWVQEAGPRRGVDAHGDHALGMPVRNEHDRRDS